MGETFSKVGIISCSGEEIAEGTVARQAVRRVLEALRPQQTVTLCLPLFLAGEEGERRFAREHPTITVDGCSKLCAKQGTEKYSGQVSASLIVSDILGDRAKGCHRSTRNVGKADEEAVWMVAERIAAEVDALASSQGRGEPGDTPAASAACCACGGTPQGGTLEIKGKPVAVGGLPLIFQHLEMKGLDPDANCGDLLLNTLKVYHFIDAHEEADYRNAVEAAYRAHCRRRAND
jgi:hypothetical protein